MIVEEDEEMSPVKKKIEVQKDLVSGANVSMPKNFLKPFDFSLTLILSRHPVLRRYLPLVEQAEGDTSFHLYPNPQPRVDLRDEIQLRNAKTLPDLDFKDQISKTVSGAFIN